MTKTQLDPRSSIRACLCTEDFCNHDEQGDGDYNDDAINRIFSNTTYLHSNNHNHLPAATPSTPESGVQCSEVLVQVVLVTLHYIQISLQLV